jgi:HK97 gp10 family phage protein
MAQRDRGAVRGRFYVLVGADETIKKLEDLIEKCPRGLATAVRHCTEAARARAVALAPGRTGTGSLKQHIFTTYFDEQLTGAVFVGPIRDYRAYTRVRRVSPVDDAGFGVGLRHKMFPRWLEFGTRKMDPRPFLLPAGEYGWSLLQDQTQALVERYVREAQ